MFAFYSTKNLNFHPRSLYGKFRSASIVHLWAATPIFACALYLQQALARPSTSDESASERAGSVTGTLDICNYIDEAFEKPVLITAFEDARAIASAAVQYKWGNDWQSICKALSFFGSKTLEDIVTEDASGICE